MKKTFLLVGILLLVLSSLEAKVNADQANYKTIKYKSQGYAIRGNVTQNEFAEGGMEIFTIQTGIMLFRGTYFEINGRSYLTTTLSSHGGNDTLRCILAIGNMDNNKYQLTPNPKIASSLNVLPALIGSGRGKTAYHNPVFLKKDSSDAVYHLRVLFPDFEMQATIPADEVNGNFGIKLGMALLKKDDFNRLSYVEDSRVDIPWYYLVESVKNEKEVTIMYKNGDIFVGSIRGEGSAESSDYYTPKEGRYVFKTGEIYEGKCNIINGYNRARRGTAKGKLWFEGNWTFSDGQKEEGYWPQKYGVDKNDEFLQYEGTPTEVHNLALKLFEAKQQKQREEELAEAKAAEAKEKRKRENIRQYGSYYGSLINEGRLELGMTEEMVCKIVSKEYYVVNKQKENNDIVETWIFSQSRMEMGMFDQFGAEGLLAISLMNELSGGQLVGEFAKELTFTNGKLSRIRY